MFNASSIKTMLTMQHSLNTAIMGVGYLSKRLPYYRAAWTEAAELMDHYGWAWWKKQVPNLEASKLELIDIWHFILSETLLQSYADLARVNPSISDEAIILRAVSLYTEGSDESNKQYRGADFLECAEVYTGQLLEKRRLWPEGDEPAYLCSNIFTFHQMCDIIGLSDDSIYIQYVFKNSLNLFRRQNGYKEGTYQKNTWGPAGNMEDNDYLNVLMSEMTGDPLEGLFEAVSAKLAAAYVA